MEARIMTQHSESGKHGVNISQQKYDLVRRAIICSIRQNGEISFKELTADVKRKLDDRLDGSISWYVTTVKLDLEARGVIERLPGSRPQLLLLVLE